MQKKKKKGFGTLHKKFNNVVFKIKNKSVSVVVHKGMTNHNRITQQNHT